MEIKGKEIIKKITKTFVIGVISSIFLFVFSLTFEYLLESTFDSNIYFPMNDLISVSLFTVICLQSAVVMTGFIYIMIYSDKKICPALTVLIPLLIILLLTTTFKVQFFSYSNDGISDLKKIYKMATCKHELCNMGYFLQDKDGNNYDIDYVLNYLDNHPESDTKRENNLERPGTGYGKCTKCGYIINHYVVGRVKGTKYVYEYDDVKHKNSILVLTGPVSHLHDYTEKDKNLKKSVHVWNRWKPIKTHELGDIQVRSCSVCGMEDCKK